MLRKPQTLMRGGTWFVMTALLAAFTGWVVGCGGGGGGGGSLATPQPQVTATFATIPTTSEILTPITPLFSAVSTVALDGSDTSPLTGLSVAGAYQKGSSGQVPFTVTEIGRSGVYLGTGVQVDEPGDYTFSYIFTTGGEVKGRQFSVDVGALSVNTDNMVVTLEPRPGSPVVAGPLSLRFTATQAGAPVANLAPLVYFQDPSGRIVDLVLGDNAGELTNEGAGVYTATLLAADLPLPFAGDFDVSFDSNGVAMGGEIASFRLTVNQEGTP